MTFFSASPTIIWKLSRHQIRLCHICSIIESLDVIQIMVGDIFENYSSCCLIDHYPISLTTTILSKGQSA